MTAGLDQLARVLGGLAHRDHPLGELTTYRVGGRAALFVEVGSRGDLEAVRRALARVPTPVPLLVLGKGSNLLVADRGFPGLVVRLGSGFSAIDLPSVPRAGDVALVRAGAGAGLPVLARRAAEAGLRGLEWAVGVPGSVGGAVRMNAGGHGADTAACLVRYEWLDLASERGGTDPPDRLGLGYRTSLLRPSEVVLWAELAVEAGDVARSRAVIADIVRWRRANQPGGSNAGSVFANPPGDAAGRLVEAAGLKGLRLGTARVSDKHANFILVDDGGSADDVHRLMVHVAATVEERLGVRLCPEVRLVGFEPEDGPAGPQEQPARGGAP